MSNKRPAYFVDEAKRGFQSFFESYLLPHYRKKKSIESDKLKCDNMVKISKFHLRYDDINALKEKWESETIVFRTGSGNPLFKLLCGFDYDEESCPYFALLSFYDESSEEVVFMMRIPIEQRKRRTSVAMLGAIGGAALGAIKAKSEEQSLSKGVILGGFLGAATSYIMNFLIE